MARRAGSASTVHGSVLPPAGRPGAAAAETVPPAAVDPPPDVCRVRCRGAATGESAPGPSRHAPRLRQAHDAGPTTGMCRRRSGPAQPEPLEFRVGQRPALARARCHATGPADRPQTSHGSASDSPARQVLLERRVARGARQRRRDRAHVPLPARARGQVQQSARARPGGRRRPGRRPPPCARCRRGCPGRSPPPRRPWSRSAPRTRRSGRPPAAARRPRPAPGRCP